LSEIDLKALLASQPSRRKADLGVVIEEEPGRHECHIGLAPAIN
jgi:hypothetical protein